MDKYCLHIELCYHAGTKNSEFYECQGLWVAYRNPTCFCSALSLQPCDMEFAISCNPLHVACFRFSVVAFCGAYSQRIPLIRPLKSLSLFER